MTGQYPSSRSNAVLPFLIDRIFLSLATCASSQNCHDAFRKLEAIPSIDVEKSYPPILDPFLHAPFRAKGRVTTVVVVMLVAVVIITTATEHGAFATAVTKIAELPHFLGGRTVFVLSAV